MCRVCTAGEARIDKVLRDAVRAKDKAAVVGILASAYQQGQYGDHRPIICSRMPRLPTAAAPFR